MIEQTPLPADLEWRAQWIKEVQRRARVEVPAWVRPIKAQRPRPLPPSPIAAIPSPVTPIPDAPVLGTFPETGPMDLRRTAIISALQLLPVSVRDTRELVSSAVRWFFERHGCLPQVVTLNPLRSLAICQDFFSVDCEDLGCYTVQIQSDLQLSCDVVRLEGRKYAWSGSITDFYL